MRGRRSGAEFHSGLTELGLQCAHGLGVRERPAGRTRHGVNVSRRGLGDPGVSEQSLHSFALRRCRRAREQAAEPADHGFTSLCPICAELALSKRRAHVLHHARLSRLETAVPAVGTTTPPLANDGVAGP